MKLSVELPDSLAEQAHALAAHKNTSMDALIAAALTAQLEQASKRPTIAERAARADWSRVSEILARVPASSPYPGDEK